MKSTARTALAMALRAIDDALAHWDQLQAVKRLSDDELFLSGTLEASIATNLNECNLLFDQFEADYKQGDIPKIPLLSSYITMLFKELGQARPLVDEMLSHMCFTKLRPVHFSPPVLPSEIHFRTTALPAELVKHLRHISEIRQLIDKTWPEATMLPNASKEPAPAPPADRPELVAAPPSGNGTAATKGTAPKNRRGRTAGVSKIDNALEELRGRLKEGRPTTIVALAKAAGCHPKTLRRSKRFMDHYRELVDGMARVIRYQGSKTGGNLEAYVDPRGELDDDEEGISQ